MTAPDTLEVTGFVAPGFEPVAETLRAATDLSPGGASFAAYSDGQLVVDIRAGWARPGQPWQEDTVSLIASVTKGLAALCIEMLDDRDEIDIDERVATYWPEFAQNGKQDITVRQIQLHTAGVIGFPGATDLVKWDGRGWNDYDAIAAGLAGAAPVWEPGTQHGYHAVTYGWLAQELVRRITGTTVGQFFVREYAGPLGADVHIGASPDVLARTAQIHTFNDDELKGVERFAMNLVMKRLQGNTLAGQAFLGDGKGRSIMNSIDDLLANDKFLTAEVPASNGLATARGLARVYQVLAQGGEVDGHRYLSADSVQRWTQPVQRRGDYLVKASIPFGKALGLEAKTVLTRTLGYAVNEPAPKATPAYGPNPNTIASEGAGGQIVFADAERRLSCGFVRSRLSQKHNTSDPLIAALYACLDSPK
jgi:CubicO group peptidase (beta-lactamase class C family)